MDISEVSAEEYSLHFSKPYHYFNCVQFNELNKSKCEKLHFLIFKNSKIRLGIIFGQKDNCLLSPFSAPYGGFSYKESCIQTEYIDEAMTLLDEYCKSNKVKEVVMILPPFFYDNSFITKHISSLVRHGYLPIFTDINHSFPTSKINQNYESEVLWRNARKNLNISSKNNFVFKKVQDYENIKKAYEVIELNRTTKNIPLRMSFEQVYETMQIIANDVFILELDNVAVASAIVFHISPAIVQIVYWGDNPEYYEKRTMNFLSNKIFRYYKNLGIRIVDIGQSTVDSIPNYGLCAFKESIGCESTLKYTFKKEFK